MDLVVTLAEAFRSGFVSWQAVMLTFVIHPQSMKINGTQNRIQQ